VILGVSGHNVKEQIEMIDRALAPVVADGTMAGLGLWEITLSQGPESNSDHAAKWETSNMMFLYPMPWDDGISMPSSSKRTRWRCSASKEPPYGTCGGKSR
jgi:hypothetical protein